MGPPSKICWNGTSALQPEEITSITFIGVLSINVLIRKKARNVSYAPRTYIQIHTYFWERGRKKGERVKPTNYCPPSCRALAHEFKQHTNTRSYA